MATIVSFKFDSWDAAKEANNKIWSECGGNSATEQSYSSFIIAISDKCTDPEKASKICQAHGGVKIS